MSTFFSPFLLPSFPSRKKLRFHCLLVARHICGNSLGGGGFDKGISLFRVSTVTFEPGIWGYIRYSLCFLALNMKQYIPMVCGMLRMVAYLWKEQMVAIIPHPYIVSSRWPVFRSELKRTVTAVRCHTYVSYHGRALSLTENGDNSLACQEITIVHKFSSNLLTDFILMTTWLHISVVNFEFKFNAKCFLCLLSW